MPQIGGNNALQMLFLRLDIGGEWFASDMASCLDVLNTVYELQRYLRGGSLSSFISIEFLSQPVAMLFVNDWLRQTRKYPTDLQIVEIQYSSPGRLILSGLRGFLVPLKNLVMQCVDYGFHKRKMELEIEGKELELAAKRIELARLGEELNQLQLVHVQHFLESIDVARFDDLRQKLLEAILLDKVARLSSFSHAQMLISAQLIDNSDSA
jgi:hypothetical protein